jgi:hypothetical protein
MTWYRTAGVLAAALLISSGVLAQDPGAAVPLVKTGGSKGMKLLAHLNTGGFGKAANLEVEQELSRGFIYVSGFTGYNFHVVDARDPGNVKTVYKWTISDPELHQGIGAMDGKYFKIKGRYFYVQSFQFAQGGPDADLGAIVFDVTGLPDGTKVREIARIREPETPGGFHNMYAYKHSDGRSLLVTHVNAQHANVYDMEKVIAGGDPKGWLIAKIPNPTPDTKGLGGGYHDFFIGYDPAQQKDKFYGAGMGGYSVFDITRVETPELLFTITGYGLQVAHTITPTPDHAFAVAETEYEYTPLRLYDLRPGQSGQTKNITQPIGAWTSDWQVLPHQQEVRWPYVFVANYEDGLQVFNMINPAKPRTVGHYYTCECEHRTGFGGGPQNGYRGTSLFNGAFGVDIRNADGLVAIADMNTGLWLFRMDGFQGWNGNDWNMPNISSAQDWDNGPVRQSGLRPKPAT